MISNKDYKDQTVPQLCLCKLRYVSWGYTDVRNCPPMVAEPCCMTSITQGPVCETSSSPLSCAPQHRGAPSACARSDPAALPPGHPSCCPSWALQGFVDGVRHHACNLAHTKGEGLLVNAMAGSSAAARPWCGCSGCRHQLWKGFRPHVCCPNAWGCLLDHRAQTTGCLWA